jgi:hypothetical protein
MTSIFQKTRSKTKTACGSGSAFFYEKNQPYLYLKIQMVGKKLAFAILVQNRKGERSEIVFSMRSQDSLADVGRQSLQKWGFLSVLINSRSQRRPSKNCFHPGGWRPAGAADFKVLDCQAGSTIKLIGRYKKEKKQIQYPCGFPKITIS